MTSRAGYLVVVMAIVALVTVAPSGALTVPAGAQDAPETTAETPATLPNIIPQPNSGREPEFEGEPGTWPQYAVMGLILVGLAGIGLLVTRESRSKLAARGAQSDDQKARGSGR